MNVDLTVTIHQADEPDQEGVRWWVEHGHPQHEGDELRVSASTRGRVETRVGQVFTQAGFGQVWWVDCPCVTGGPCQAGT